MENKIEKLQIFEDGRKFETTFTEKFKNRKVWEYPDFSEIKSVIPGSVIDISVNVGDEVAKGGEMMVYEAMKMHNIIRAPFDGVVDKIFVSKGDKLPKGHIMIYLIKK